MCTWAHGTPLCPTSQQAMAKPGVCVCVGGTPACGACGRDDSSRMHAALHPTRLNHQRQSPPFLSVTPCPKRTRNASAAGPCLPPPPRAASTCASAAPSRPCLCLPAPPLPLAPPHRPTPRHPAPFPHLSPPPRPAPTCLTPTSPHLQLLPRRTHSSHDGGPQGCGALADDAQFPVRTSRPGARAYTPSPLPPLSVCLGVSSWPVPFLLLRFGPPPARLSSLPLRLRTHCAGQPPPPPQRAMRALRRGAAEAAGAQRGRRGALRA